MILKVFTGCSKWQSLQFYSWVVATKYAYKENIMINIIDVFCVTSSLYLRNYFCVHLCLKLWRRKVGWEMNKMWEKKGSIVVV